MCLRLRSGLLLLATLSAGASVAQAEEPKRNALAPEIEHIDRVVVRWYAHATGGVEEPQFLTARELAFLARIEAMRKSSSSTQAFSDKHVREAIHRHITETMLAQLPVDPAPTPQQVGKYAEAARLIIEQQVGGRAKLNAAAIAEGIVSDELNALLRRHARASWYLDKMVTPMLEPTETDLREAHQRGASPYADVQFEKIVEPLRRWYIATRLNSALDQYYRNIRTRVTIRLLLW